MSSNKPKVVRILGVGDTDIVNSYANSMSNFIRTVEAIPFTAYEEVVKNRMKKIQRDYDMILLLGGSDINPAIYGDPNPMKHPDGTDGMRIMFNNIRDDIESLVIDEAKGKIPILGICRGLQMLWAKTGGKLIHHIQPRHSSLHPVFLREDWRWLDPDKNELRRVVAVNSMHHQGLDLGRDLAPGWDIVATAPDGLPEAAINRELKMGGVQFHPEIMDKSGAGRWIWDNMVRELVGVK